MKTVCAHIRIANSNSSMEHPQIDGLVERMNETIKILLATNVENEPHLWDEYLFTFCNFLQSIPQNKPP
ncbi:hypothetical protein CLU79DRAFT_780437 [Phycomyces nitens]|nr:hypothetical protein CLU79DRAFT_780437 [Phycomyces nitens]